MTKIVINDCYGGFGISDKAIEEYAKIKGIELEKRKPKYPFFDNQIDYYYAGTDNMFIARYIERDDPVLIKIVTELGESANDWASYLKIVEIPDDVDWQIEEYDGLEHIAEKHRTWS